MRQRNWFLLLACVALGATGCPDEGEESAMSIHRGGQLIRGCICPGRPGRVNAPCDTPPHDGAILIKASCDREAANAFYEGYGWFCEAVLESSKPGVLELEEPRLLRIQADGQVYEAVVDNTAYTEDRYGVTIYSDYVEPSGNINRVDFAITDVLRNCR